MVLSEKCKKIVERAESILFYANSDYAATILHILTGNNSAETLSGLVTYPHTLLDTLERYHLIQKNGNTTYILTECGREAVPIARKYAPSTMSPE